MVFATLASLLNRNFVAWAVKQPPDSAKGQNPGFFDLNPGEEAKSSGQEDSIKAGVTKHSMREHELENSTSDAASHGSHINTFDSLSQFEKAGMTNHLATTFRRPKPSQYQVAGIAFFLHMVASASQHLYLASLCMLHFPAG